MSLTPDSLVQYVKSVGPRRAEQLNRLGIKTVSDLLTHFPSRYEDRRSIISIAELKEDQTQTIRGIISSAGELKRRGGRRMFQAVIKDDSGFLRSIWFSTHGGYLSTKFKPGKHVIATGKVAYNRYQRCLEMMHPDMELFEKGDTERSGGILPIYPLTGGISQKNMRSIISKAMEAGVKLPETLPAKIIKSLKLPGRDEAVKKLHAPDKNESLDLLNSFGTAAHRRLIFDELFLIECAMALLRDRNAERVRGVQIDLEKSELYDAVSSLPFELTPDQKKSLNDIVKDLQSVHPMNRLLEGDVGCGKTVVAALAAAFAKKGGCQSAFMAPTEILAQQHYATLTNMSGVLGLKTALLTSAIRNREKEKIKQAAMEGELDLVVGTHALIQRDVLFKKLGFVVIDEQHRFGVRQRADLMEKGDKPNILIMTATPIPRTLAMTLYSDLDISTIRSMPKGRGEVETRIIQPGDRSKANMLIHREVKKGRQAFIIYPLVEESEKLELKAATRMWEEYDKKIFRDLRVGLVHGKMGSDEKNRVMSRFTNRELDVLVSTTVVEVGIDQPNAAVMMIEHAERFGLAQLHQLRGRVGRGAEKSYCLLAIEYPMSALAKERLKVMTKSRDGFVIAEKDLELRGTGDLFGTRQWGLPTLKVANLFRDMEILKQAKAVAFDYIKSDPELKSPDSQPLKKELLRNWRDKFSLIDVG